MALTSQSYGGYSCSIARNVAFCVTGALAAGTCLNLFAGARRQADPGGRVLNPHIVQILQLSGIRMENKNTEKPSLIRIRQPDGQVACFRKAGMLSMPGGQIRRSDPGRNFRRPADSEDARPLTGGAPFHCQLYMGRGPWSS